MREFAKISPQFWVGSTGRELRQRGPLAQLVALYLVTSPHVNYIGMYRLPVAYIADDLQLSVEQVTSALLDIESVGFARLDPKSGVVWVIEAARWQIGDSLRSLDKRCAAIQREYDSLPSDCPFLAKFFERYGAAYHLTPRGGSGIPAPKTEAAAAPATKTAEPAPAEAAPATDGQGEQLTAAQVPPQLPAEEPAEAPAPVTAAAALGSFQAWRDELGRNDPEVDQLIARRVLTLAHTDGDAVANNALYYAYADGDADCRAWVSHVAAARARRDEEFSEAPREPAVADNYDDI